MRKPKRRKSSQNRRALGATDDTYDLRVTIDNEFALYRQKQWMRSAIAKKVCAGKFDAAKATKGFRAIVDAAALEISGPQQARYAFPGAVRNQTAAALTAELKSDINRCLTKGECGDAPPELSKCVTTARPLAGAKTRRASAKRKRQ